MLNNLGKFNEPELLANKVFQYVEKAILTGKIKGGARLIERELAERFRVSKIPVREAIYRLESEGLVDVIPRRGAIVHRVTRKEIEDYYKVRILLEKFAAREAVANIDERDLERLKSIINKMKLCIENKDPAKYLILSQQFHEIFNRACKNDVYYKIYARLRKHTFWPQTKNLSSPGGPERSIKQYTAILAAFNKRDSDLAERLVQEHIEYGANIFFKSFDPQEL